MQTARPRIRSANRRSARRGAAMVLMLFLLVIVIGMVAFAVDAGLMVLLRAQIQNAVDAGALAAALQLRDNNQDIQTAEEAARAYVQLNRVGMTQLVPEDAIDVEPGIFDGRTNTFTATNFSPNAVRVFARQDAQPFFFARIFGQQTFGSPAEAVASADPQPLDAMMVLDLSGSMADEGRIEALRNSAPVFVDVVREFDDGDDRIGVMGLSANPDKYDPKNKSDLDKLYHSGLHPWADYNVGVLEAPLTDDFAWLENSVLNKNNLEAGKYTNYTGTGAAIGDAAHYLKYGPEAREDSRKAIVLMSDGQANRPSGNGAGYAKAMAQYAADRGITIYTISLGNGADVNLMQSIADITGGTHFDATGSGEATLTDRLTDAFEKAAAGMKRATLVK